MPGQQKKKVKQDGGWREKHIFFFGKENSIYEQKIKAKIERSPPRQSAEIRGYIIVCSHVCIYITLALVLVAGQSIDKKKSVAPGRTIGRAGKISTLRAH